MSAHARPVVNIYEEAQTLACDCLTNHTNDDEAANSRLSLTPSSSTPTPADAATDFSTNTISASRSRFIVKNDSNVFLMTCNNTYGFFEYNASEMLYQYFIYKYYNDSSTENTTETETRNQIVVSTKFLFLERFAENNETYFDFFGCYDENKTKTFLNTRIDKISGNIGILHCLATIIVILFSFMFNSCLAITRKRLLNRSIDELPRLKQVFTPALLRKTSRYLQVVNQGTRAKKFGSQIVRQNSQKFGHLGCDFKQAQTYRSMIEFSFHQVEDLIATLTTNSSGYPLHRKSGQSVCNFLLGVVPLELNLDHATTYKDRVLTYIRLYERARYGADSLNASDLAVALEQVRFMKSVFRSSSSTTK